MKSTLMLKKKTNIFFDKTLRRSFPSQILSFPKRRDGKDYAILLKKDNFFAQIKNDAANHFVFHLFA